MARKASRKKRQPKQSVPAMPSTHSRPAAPLNPQARILDLQRTAGNRAVEALLKPNPEGKPHAVENVPPIVDAALHREGGQALDAATRESMEPLLGQDLSQVRIHKDSEAAASAEAVNALAYTAGQDIVFGAGQYAPETNEGRELLTHELGHVVGQRSAGAERGAAIMRAPKPGTADPPSLFASTTIPAPSVMRVDGSIVATVYFSQNDFLMNTSNLAVVEKLADELSFMSSPTIAVDGYASSEGTEEYNLHLSDLRRQTVIAILRNKSTGTADVGGTAHGEADPAEAETATDAKELESQRARNRRVTIFIMSSVTPKSQPPPKPPTPGPEPESEEEEANRRVQDVVNRRKVPKLPERSLGDMARKKLDEWLDTKFEELGVPKKWRGRVKDAIKTGSEKAVDAVLDQAGLSQGVKDGIKAAAKSVWQQKF